MGVDAFFAFFVVAATEKVLDIVSKGEIRVCGLTFIHLPPK